MDASAVLREWHGRTGAYSPEYYAYYGPDDASDGVRDALDGTVGRDAAVLELGSSAGRHLAHLHESGYDDLTGIEINADAHEVMAETYPDLADAGTFHFAAIEDVIADFPADRFDATFSVQTLQHIHPDHAWVFEEAVRVTGSRLVTVEIEGDDARDGRGTAVSMADEAVPIYHRDWGEVFTDLGAIQAEVRELERATVRVFRTNPDGRDTPSRASEARDGSDGGLEPAKQPSDARDGQ